MIKLGFGLRIPALVVAAMLVTGAEARAGEVLYGIDFGAPGKLIAIDPATAATSLIGGSGILSAPAYDPANATLYSVGYFGGSSYSLATVNTTTGVGTPVGSLGMNQPPSLAFNADGSKLYGIDFAVSNLSLYEINPATGAPTFIASTGMYFQAVLAINGANVGYTVDTYGNFSRINLATGALTPIANLGDAFSGLAFDQNDVLYGVTVHGDNLVTLNTTNGAATTIGHLNYGDVSIGFAFDRAAVPAPGGIGFALLWLGALARRKFTSRP